MSVVQKEVEECLKGFNTSKPVYRVSSSWNGNIALAKVSRPTSNNDDALTKTITNSVQEYFDWNTQRHVFGERNLNEITNNIRWEMQRYFVRFVNKYNDSKNNKLTILYRWFNGAIAARVMECNPDLEKDLWNIYKWLTNSEAHSKVSEHTTNAIKLLEVVRQRYEAKGIKV